MLPAGALICTPCCSVATVLLKCHVKKRVVTCDDMSHRGKKTKNYFVARQIVAEKSLWAGPTQKKSQHANCRREELVGGTHREKKKKIRACGLCLRLELVACCLRPTPDRHYALSRIGRLMVELLSITESHAFKLQKLWSSRVSQF
jgi:hypothetical protein